MMNFGERLQRALDESNMSQSELGRRVGATSQSVNGWCQSGILPRKETLEQLPGVLGRPLYWFFMTDEEEGSLSNASPSAYQSKEAHAELLAVYDQLPKEEQHRFIDLMKTRLEELDKFMEEYFKRRKIAPPPSR